MICSTAHRSRSTAARDRAIAASRSRAEARVACARRAPWSSARARGDEPVYGINTGFGIFADVKIAPDALAALQLNLLRSHAAGVGEPLPVRAVRATMALRANVLAKGFSGIRVETLEALHRAAQSRRASARAVAADRSAPAATWRRSPTWRWC